MVHPILFTCLSIMICAGALGVLLARSPVYAVLSLVIALFGLSALFVTLGAPFVAVIQILVYAGAILVLFLFVVMLSDMAPEALLQIRVGTLRVIGPLFGLFFLWQLSRVVPTLVSTASAVKTAPVEGTTAIIGKSLFTTYALPFEVASLLLLAGIIGAIVLVKRKL